MGILAMTNDDIDCKLPLQMWVTTQEEEHRPLLHQLTKTFLGNLPDSQCHPPSLLLY